MNEIYAVSVLRKEQIVDHYKSYLEKLDAYAYPRFKCRNWVGLIIRCEKNSLELTFVLLIFVAQGTGKTADIHAALMVMKNARQMGEVLMESGHKWSGTRLLFV